LKKKHTFGGGKKLPGVFLFCEVPIKQHYSRYSQGFFRREGGIGVVRLPPPTGFLRRRQFVMESLYHCSNDTYPYRPHTADLLSPGSDAALPREGLDGMAQLQQALPDRQRLVAAPLYLKSGHRHAAGFAHVQAQLLGHFIDDTRRYAG
jgi:hypothetical protein